MDVLFVLDWISLACLLYFQVSGLVQIVITWLSASSEYQTLVAAGKYQAWVVAYKLKLLPANTGLWWFPVNTRLALPGLHAILSHFWCSMNAKPTLLDLGMILSCCQVRWIPVLLLSFDVFDRVSCQWILVLLPGFNVFDSAGYRWILILLSGFRDSVGYC